MRLLIGFGCLLILTGCGAVARKMYGIKKPELETKESLRRYAGSINLDPALVLTTILPAIKARCYV